MNSIKKALSKTFVHNVCSGIYQEIDAYEISKNGREKQGLTEASLLYGEIPFKTLQEIVEEIRPNLGGVCYDLGSGTGKAVMQLQLLYDFSKVVGIELVESLYLQALESQNKLRKIGEKYLEIANKATESPAEFRCESFFNSNFSDADFILINHPFRGEEKFLELEEIIIAQLKPGCKIATIIRSLKNPKFQLLSSIKRKFSWGEATVHSSVFLPENKES
jgi:hypothetical protein